MSAMVEPSPTCAECTLLVDFTGSTVIPCEAHASVSIDCRDGKHAACVGDAWDEKADELTVCGCGCHVAPVIERLRPVVLAAALHEAAAPALAPARRSFDFPSAAAGGVVLVVLVLVVLYMSGVR